MPAPKKYPDELLRERAVRMVAGLRSDPATPRGVLPRVGQQLGINKDTLRNWVDREEIDTGLKPGITTAEVRTQRSGAIPWQTVHLIRASPSL